jgi:hypothetical protein
VLYRFLDVHKPTVAHQPPYINCFQHSNCRTRFTLMQTSNKHSNFQYPQTMLSMILGSASSCSLLEPLLIEGSILNSGEDTHVDSIQEGCNLLVGVSLSSNSSDLTWSTQVSNQSSPSSSIMISRYLEVVSNGQVDCLGVRESCCFSIELVVLHASCESQCCYLQSANHGRAVFFAEVECPLISMWRLRDDDRIASMRSNSS